MVRCTACWISSREYPRKCCAASSTLSRSTFVPWPVKILICAVLLREMRTPLAVSALRLCTEMVMSSRPSLLHVSKIQNWNEHLPMMMRVPRHPEMIAASLGGETMMFPMDGGENVRARGKDRARVRMARGNAMWRTSVGQGLFNFSGRYFMYVFPMSF